MKLGELEKLPFENEDVILSDDGSIESAESVPETTGATNPTNMSK